MDRFEARAWLDAHLDHEAASPLGRGAPADLSLEPMRGLLAALGDPQDSYRIVHVTGTNGKGSVARFTSDLLAGLELAVGTYTSPHLHRLEERIAYDGQPIPEAELTRVLSLLAEVEPLVEGSLTWFELMTAAAFVWFADQGIDVAVIEVGMLGRLDATNVATADVAVITSIARDHVEPGPHWRREVATAKAGIITAGRPLVIGEVPDAELSEILDAEGPDPIVALGRDATVVADLPAVGGRVLTLSTPYAPYDDLFVPFHGPHQVANAALAILTTEALLGRAIDPELVAGSWQRTELPGRFELLSTEPTVLADVAHNAAAAAASRATLDQEFARLGSWVLVVGLGADRDPVEFLQAVKADDFDAVIVTSAGGPRSLSAEALAAAAESRGIPAEAVPTPEEAVRRARAVTAEDDLVLVVGQTPVVAAARANASGS